MLDPRQLPLPGSEAPAPRPNPEGIGKLTAKVKCCCGRRALAITADWPAPACPVCASVVMMVGAADRLALRSLGEKQQAFTCGDALALSRATVIVGACFVDPRQLRLPHVV